MQSWRKVDETYHEDVARERLKKYSELQLWGYLYVWNEGTVSRLVPEDEEEKQLAAHLLAMEKKEYYNLRLHLESIARPALSNSQRTTPTA